MSQPTSGPTAGAGATGTNRTLIAVLAWAWVAIPFLYGVIMLLLKIPALF